VEHWSSYFERCSKNFNMDVPQLFVDVKQKYGFPFALKKEQEEIIAYICANKNVFVLLPTGFGKSVTFLIPPLIFDEVLIILAYRTRRQS
jgi:superfamily II DNA helicase RecQ